ncbi:MAG: hypothetical protein FWH03_04225 [Firmicutes bacterium]|nr:hypothetical protein [Bacillota bacterium]
MDIIHALLSNIRKTRPFLMYSYNAEELQKQPESYSYPKMLDTADIKEEIMSRLLRVVEHIVSALKANLSDAETLILVRSVIEKAGL